MAEKQQYDIKMRCGNEQEGNDKAANRDPHSGKDGPGEQKGITRSS